MDKSLGYNVKHKKRRFVKCDLEAPFPIPIESLRNIPASNEQWCYFTGALSNTTVTVKHSGDMEFLSKLVSRSINFQLFG